MPRGSNLKTKHIQNRQTRIDEINDAIAFMRENKITINKTTLAEELGISRRTLYSDYITKHLLTIAEFNPTTIVVSDDPSKQHLKEENAALKLRVKELSLKCKALEMEVSTIKEANKSLNGRYQRLLGAYQTDIGSKITPI